MVYHDLFIFQIAAYLLFGSASILAAVILGFLSTTYIYDKFWGRLMEVKKILIYSLNFSDTIHNLPSFKLVFSHPPRSSFSIPKNKDLPLYMIFSERKKFNIKYKNESGIIKSPMSYM